MYDLAHPITGTPAPGVMKFTILVRGFLDHYYYIFIVPEHDHQECLCFCC